MKIRRILIKLGLINFKIGDKVKPNPKLFKSDYQIIENKDYAIVKEIKGRTIKLENTYALFTRKELELY